MRSGSPAGRKELFQKNFEDLRPRHRFQFKTHVVKKGDTLCKNCQNLPCRSRASSPDQQTQENQPPLRGNEFADSCPHQPARLHPYSDEESLQRQEEKIVSFQYRSTSTICGCLKGAIFFLVNRLTIFEEAAGCESTVGTLSLMGGKIENECYRSGAETEHHAISCERIGGAWTMKQSS